MLTICFLFLSKNKTQAQTPTHDAIEYESSLDRDSGGWTKGLGEIGGFGLPNALPESIITSALLWILSVFAMLAALAFVISGVMFLTSGGNEKMTSQAKEYIKYSIIGLFVALSGYIIVIFINDMLTGF